LSPFEPGQDNYGFFLIVITGSAFRFHWVVVGLR